LEITEPPVSKVSASDNLNELEPHNYKETIDDNKADNDQDNANEIFASEQHSKEDKSLSPAFFINVALILGLLLIAGVIFFNRKS